MNLESVLSRLERVRRNGDQFMALCPGHADKNPSLSVREENGRVLLHCFAGCSIDMILSAVGISASELSSLTSTRPREVASYDYTDEAGELLYQVVRYAPKAFKQRKPDGRGGWTWNLNGARRVLYRLPEVLGAETVLICEGEKDVEAARSRGFVATCNSGGAGKWRDEYSEFLRGKNVVLIPDQDEPGRKHAEQVARAIHLIAARVQVFNLPSPLKDLSEWPAALSTEALKQLLDESPDWRPDAVVVQEAGFRLTLLRDLLLEPEEQISWLLEDKLPAGGLSVLCAKPKVGKSTWARALCLAVARGEKFMGCGTKKGAVIYLALEEKRSEVARHFRDLGATGEEEIHTHAASAPQEAVTELCGLTREFQPVLIVVDPLFKFVRIRDEKAYAEVCNAIEPLLTLARESGAHVLLVHHSGKAERDDATDSILGSTAIFGGVDSAVILKKSERYRTIQSTQRYGVDWPETVLDFNPVERSLSLGAEKSEAELERIGEAIIAYMATGEGVGRTEPEILASVEGMNATKRKALRALVGKGQLMRAGSGRKGDPFLYKCSYACTHMGLAGSSDPTRTGVRESLNEPQDTENTGGMLVRTPQSGPPYERVRENELFDGQTE